jgi:uncharacterized protein
MSTSATQSRTSDAVAATVFPYGQFVWYDLMTRDEAAAIAFYKEVAGWGTQPFDGPKPYTMFTNGGTPLGGVMQTPPSGPGSAPPNWLPHVAVRDVDATVAQVKSLGGTVHHGPQDIPNVGRFAVIQDPQGAFISVYASSTGAPEPGGVPKVGEFSWHELTTTDQHAAWDFYSTLFGWKKMESMPMGPGSDYQMFGPADQMVGGMYNRLPEMGAVPPNWLCYIRVDDITRAVDAIKRLGGKIMNGPMEVPGGDQVAMGFDPQGAAFGVHAKKA